MPNTYDKRACLGYEQVTGLSSAKAFQSLPVRASKAIVQVEGQRVRYRPDGTNPTTSVGWLLEDGDVVEFTSDLSRLKFIEVTATAVLNVLYY